MRKHIFHTKYMHLWKFHWFSTIRKHNATATNLISMRKIVFHTSGLFLVYSVHRVFYESFGIIEKYWNAATWNKIQMLHFCGHDTPGGARFLDRTGSRISADVIYPNNKQAHRADRMLASLAGRSGCRRGRACGLFFAAFTPEMACEVAGAFC